jgi:Transglutaminase-like superfamily
MCAGCRPARPLLQIATAFGGSRVDAEAIEDDLCALAACALAGRCAPPADQLTIVAAAMEPFALSDDQIGLDDLLLHRVLTRWSGAPVVLAAVAAEAGARAGLDVAIAGDGRRHLLVHRDGSDLAWDPAAGVRAIGEHERTELRLRCGHQVAFAALAQIVERATRAGDLSVALHATELRLQLPLAAPLRSRVEAEKAGLLAALN